MRRFAFAVALLAAAVVPGMVWAACPDPLPADTICLEWVAPTQNVDGSPLTDLAGYRAYYGAESGVYGDPIAIPFPDVTSAELVAGDQIVVEAPADGGEVALYFAMTALDDDGNESALSNEVREVVVFPDTLPPATPQLMRVLIHVTVQ